MAVKDHELKVFFAHVIQVLERLDISYVVQAGYWHPVLVSGQCEICTKHKDHHA
jgi:hypothetical protein